MADQQTKEQTETRREPFDVMVATFEDPQGANQAYDALRSMQRQGQINLGSAVVVDRNERGKMRVKRAALPASVWAAIGAGILAMTGIAGLAIWGIARGVRRMMPQS